jgi:hypothetical protein
MAGAGSFKTCRPLEFLSCGISQLRTHYSVVETDIANQADAKCAAGGGATLEKQSGEAGRNLATTAIGFIGGARLISLGLDADAVGCVWKDPEQLPIGTIHRHRSLAMVGIALWLDRQGFLDHDLVQSIRVSIFDIIVLELDRGEGELSTSRLGPCSVKCCDLVVHWKRAGVGTNYHTTTGIGLKNLERRRPVRDAECDSGQPGAFQSGLAACHVGLIGQSLRYRG